MADFDPDLVEQEEQTGEFDDVAPSAAAPTPNTPVTYREALDVKAQRQAVFDRVREAYANRKLEYQGHRLEFADVDYHKPRDYHKREEKEAILGRRRLHWSLRGRLRLVGPDGKVIKEDPKVRTLAQVPYLTRRGTFVHNGNEYVVSNQQRLRAGIYTRRQSNGDVESQFNIIPGTGRGFRVNMEPSTGVFRIQVGQSNMKLFPVLKDLGFTDKDLKEQWGDAIYQANALADDKGERLTLPKLVAKLGRPEDSGLPPSEARARLLSLFERMRLDPDVTRRTMGRPFEKVDNQTLLAATKRILGISRNEEKPDDRDDLPFQSFHSVEDFFAEHVNKDSDQLIRQAFWKLKNGRDVPDNYFTKQLQSVLISSGMGAPLQEINPVEILDARHKINRLGEGGIGSTEGVSRDARGVQPSHFGFIDVIRAPESQNIGLDMRLASGAVRGSDGRLYTRMRSRKTGGQEYLPPDRVADSVVAFPGELDRAKALGLSKVRAMVQGKIKYVPLSKVEYDLPDAGHLFTPGTNFVPLTANLKGQRLLMGARMSVSGDTPLLVVRASGEAYYGPIEGYVWKQGDRALSIDKKSKQVVWSNIVSKHKHKNVLPMHRVMLSSGRFIDATEDHSFVTLSDSGDLTKVHTQELVRGVPIPVVAEMPSAGTAEITSWVVPAGNKHNAYSERVFPVDFNLGWVHGLYISEGYGQGPNNGGRPSVVFANCDLDVLKKTVDYFSGFGVAARQRSGRRDGVPDRVLVCWKQLHRRLSEEYGDGAYNKRLPSWVFFAPKSFREGLLAGYLAGDGGVLLRRGRVRVNGSSRSAELVNGMITLCSTLGIATTQRESRVLTGPGGSAATQFYFEICSRDIEKVPRLFCERKDRRIQEAKPFSGKKNGDWLPIYKDLHSQISDVTARTSHERNKCYTQQHTRKSVSDLGIACPWLRSAVTWDSVERVVPLDSELFEYVYDLDMGDGVFMCGNGVFVHNSAQALPLEQPEAPLVQSRAPGSDKSMNAQFGSEMGAVFADQGGVVQRVTADGVIVRHDDGSTHEYELYNNHPFNQKCVSGDTRLFIRRSDGSFFTGEIAYYRVKDGDSTLSVDKRTGTVHWRPVEAVKRLENDKRLLRIRLASGRALVVTEDHSLVRLGDHGLEKVAPGELSVGMEYLPSPRNNHISPKAIPVFAQRLTPLEFGQLVGIYIAEGSRANVNCHRIACFEEEGAEQILRLVRLLCGKGRWNGSTVYMPTNQGFATWVDDFVGHGAFNKRLNRGAAIYGNDFARGVIGGFFSGDGWAAIDCNGALQVEAGTRSLELRDDLVFFAQLGGLPTTQRDVVVEGKPFFYIRIRTEAAIGVPWILQRKADTSTHGCLSERSFDVVPLPRGRRKGFYKYAGSTPRIHHMGNRGRVPVCEIAGDPWLKQWSDGIYWDRVIAVEEVEHQDYVYDLSAGNGVFWANGVFIHNTSLHNTPVVKPGDRFKPGQLLARSNFTDDRGELALGRNVRVAFHMMDGMTHEDAVVMSESASKKFSSEQLYSHTLERNDEVDQISKKQFLSKYPGTFDKRQMKTIDDHGVVLPGTVVKQGDPLILAVGRRKTKVKGSIMESQKSGFTDAAEVWDHETDGVVTDVFKTGKGWRVTVKSYTPIKVGDKTANSYGGKGVVARVVPDSEMPVDEAGNPIEVALNPMGVISRVNPSQLIESALGKVALKTGKRYVLPGFSDQNMAEFAMEELRKHGLKDTETLTDPRTGKKMADVFTGVQHFFKLHHLAESGLNARNQAAYTMDDTPAKGGYDGSKRIGLMETFSLLSHGATEVLRDAKLIRGQRNDDYWQLYRLGFNPPEPRISRPYQKFEALLQGSGINLKKRGVRTQVLPMTDQDVQALAADREIESGETVDFDSGEPVKGGLFDIAKTGGADGTKWSFIRLPEPLPNPIMEEPIKAMLGLTGPQFDRVIAGEEEIDGQTGGHAIAQALKRLNIDREIETTKQIIREGRRTKRDKAVKRLGYLTTLKKNDLRPEELMLTRAPVVPPKWRPVSRMEGVDLVADANYLYKELLESRANYEKANQLFNNPGRSRTDVYQALKAVTGMGKPVSQESQNRNLRGLLRQVLGDSPKFGHYQRSVIGQAVDNVGRAVIVPDPDYDVDEVGMPDEAAWEMFKPFIVRDLVKRGRRAADALRAVADRTPDAKEARLRVMQERPIIINRAPSLHKHNITAHFAKPVAGNALRLPIAILAGHGADFDGDKINFHVPVAEEAVEEAREKMLPSKALYSAKDFQVHMLPTQGYVMGLYLGSKADSGRPARTFRSKKDVIQAYRRGEIRANDPVQVLES